MSLLRYVAPAAAVVSSVYASQCSTSGTMTVTNSADLTGFGTCSTYTGSIAIATGATDIALDGPGRITGDVIVEPKGLIQSLSADNLRIIDGTLSLSELQNIATLSMPELTEVNNFFMSATGQELLALDLAAGVTQVSMLTIDNTYLTNLDGINLKTAENITVTNNVLLTDLTMQIKNVTGGFTIRGNPKGLNVGLSDLLTSGNFLVNDCTTLSIESYANSSGLVAFTNNDFTSLNMPNLTQANLGLAIENNPRLSNISFPALTVVGGGLDVINNTFITGNINFPKLKAAQSCTFEGDFSGVTMPVLARIPGQAKFVSTKNIQSSCNTIGNDAGGVVCDSAVSSSSASASATGSSPSSTSTHNAGSHSAASQETVYGIFGTLAALVGLFM